MKRALFEGVAVFPSAAAGVTGQGSGALPSSDSLLVDRQGFLSAVLGASVSNITGSPEKLKIGVDILSGDADDGSDLKPVEDPFITPNSKPIAAEDGLYNVDIDLLACKRFVKIIPKIEFTGGSSPKLDAEFALALGDKDFQPV